MITIKNRPDFEDLNKFAKVQSTVPYSVNQYLQDKIAGDPAAALRAREMQEAGLLNPVSVAPYADEKIAHIPSGAPVTVQTTAPTTTAAPTATPTAPTTTTTPPAASPTDPRKAQLEAEIAEVQKKVESSFQVLIDLQNKKFTYNERSSPIYSIMREEYQKQADRAAAQAYARSVANTGGYGSSYATLAAEEASRAVMDGWDDAQYDLYAAARQQFADEKASATEVYGLYKGLLEEKEAEMSLLEAEEAAKAEKEAAEAAERDKRILDAYATVAESWAESGGANEATVRSMLANSLPADVENPQEIVDEVIRRLKADSTAAITDAVSVFKNSPTVADAQVIYDTAKNNGTLEKYAGEISTSLMSLTTDAMGGDADAAVALGLDATAFGELSADDQAAAVLDVMGQLNKKGLIQGDAFVSFLQEDLDEDFENLGDLGERMSAAINALNALRELKEKRYLTYEQWLDLMTYALDETYPTDGLDITDNVWKVMRDTEIKIAQEKA